MQFLERVCDVVEVAISERVESLDQVASEYEKKDVLEGGSLDLSHILTDVELVSILVILRM